MFLFVTTSVALLAAVAFGLISFQMTSARISISIEIENLRSLFAWLKEAASHLRDKGREYREHSRES